MAADPFGGSAFGASPLGASDPFGASPLGGGAGMSDPFAAAGGLGGAGSLGGLTGNIAPAQQRRSMHITMKSRR